MDGLPPERKSAIHDQLLDNSLNLVINSLNFDFIGTNPDESVEELGTLQIPSTWRDRIQSPSTPRLFFNLYRGCATGVIPVPVGSGPWLSCFVFITCSLCGEVHVLLLCE